MSEPFFTPLLRDTSSDRVRLQTLTLLRWLAISGQILAILVASSILGLQIPVAACLVVVGLSVLVNLIVEYLFPQSQRLSESQALALLVYDMAQLALLLSLTGGLNNPFALLILAPVTISASVLDLRSGVIVGVLGIVFVSLLVPFNLPLRSGDGQILQVPTLFRYGLWLSIVIGILFLGAYSRRVASEIRAMSDAVMAAQMALAREQKLTDLGGVVAAAAHELGTPLATVKLVSTEMIRELEGMPELQEDARLIRDQADRCRDILRSMGRAGKDDLHLHQAPLIAVLREAAEPHLKRGKTVTIALAPFQADQDRQPHILRRPEVIHGLRNLVQNAVDFAQNKVWVEAHWDAETITVHVADDGAGFAAQMIGRIGDPFLRMRRPTGELEAAQSLRPGYEGMGLGLFIAKTLLERSGARISFGNGPRALLAPAQRPEWTGAVVALHWARAMIEAPEGAGSGENQPF